MSTATNPTTQAPPQTLAELVERLGNIPLERIRMQPPPGTATVDDLAQTKLCELIDGVIVEKAMGYFESRLGLLLGRILDEYAEQHDLGFVVGADGMTRLLPNKVREPDVAFYRWERVPNREVPEVAVADIAPDLAVEVYSRGNTQREMEQKRQDYFTSGVTLVWIVYPLKRNVEVWSAVDSCLTLDEDDQLEGANVLPGFTLSIRDWFERAGRGSQQS